MATTYAGILTKTPYNWPDSMVSYISFFQIPTSLCLFPLLGKISDKFVQWRARRNHGLYEPESRLFVLVLPLAAAMICSILYGQGASHPQQYHWTLYAITMSGYFFAFVGISIVSTTWLLDSYPTRAGPFLIIVCACRGFISCAVSTNVAYLIEWLGYDGTFLAFSVATTLLGTLLIPFYIYGKRLRIYTARWTKDARF
jgi:MFS family permease